MRPDQLLGRLVSLLQGLYPRVLGIVEGQIAKRLFLGRTESRHVVCRDAVGGHDAKAGGAGAAGWHAGRKGKRRVASTRRLRLVGGRMRRCRRVGGPRHRQHLWMLVLALLGKGVPP